MFIFTDQPDTQFFILLMDSKLKYYANIRCLLENNKAAITPSTIPSLIHRVHVCISCLPVWGYNRRRNGPNKQYDTDHYAIGHEYYSRSFI